MSDRRKLEALLRSDFRPFVQKSFITLSPGQTFIPSWHLDAICWKLEQVRRGKVKRLIINLPPRSLKSITASVAFPAYILGLDPTRRIICVSYSGDLARKHSGDFRALVTSLWFRSTFPTARIGNSKNTETEVGFTARGYRMSTSVGGTLTGRGGDIIIIDDPLKPDDAHSEQKRNGANEWFTNTLLSRLDDKRTGAIIIVMQRVHMDDLTGSVLEHSKEWDVLSLPAIATCDEIIPLWGGKKHRRWTGELLQPEREPQYILDALKRDLGSDSFSAQYQQEPVPPGGAMIKRHWVKRYTELELPPRSERLMILQSWDTANKGGPENDWSVCTTWLLAQNRRYYLIDVWRGRVDYPTLKAGVIERAEVFSANRVIVEDAASGTMLLQELAGRVSGIVPAKPAGDKVSRMAGASSKFEAGQVFLPESAPWLHDLEVELFAFPGARHDDQCDSISQALLDGEDSVFRWMTAESWKSLLDQVRAAPRWRPPPF